MNQAIILNLLDGVRQVKHITVINQITELSNIIAASHISNNRVCIFFNSKTIANKIVKNNPHNIVIDNNIYSDQVNNNPIYK